MKNAKILIISAVALLALLFSSCTGSDSDQSKYDFVELNIFNDSSVLNERVSYCNEDVEIIPWKLGSTATRQKPRPRLKLVARFRSPLIHGKRISATHVRIRDNYAYVTYHIKGDEIFGAIDVINIQNPKKPRLTSYASTPQIDFNSVDADYEQDPGNIRKIYLMGETENGAYLKILNIKSGRITSQSSALKLPGQSGNSIVRSADWLYASTGGSIGDGGTFVIERSSLTIISQCISSYAKCVAANGETPGSLQATLIGGPTGKVQIFTVGTHTGTPTYSWPLGNVEPYLGKNGIALSGDTAFASLGNRGLIILNATTGVEYKSIVFGQGTDATTNSVFVDDDYIYAANGDLGFHIIDRETYTVLGHVKYNGSANHGESNGKSIILANGTDGVKFLVYE